MKFTEEQAREALRAELTNKGRKTLHMSERTLAKQTSLLMKKLATEEMGLPDFVNEVIEILEDIEGGARKKDADFAKYKEDHPESPKEEPKEEKPKTTPEYEALKAKIEALEKENAESKRLSKLSAKKTELANALNSKGIKDKEWIDSLLSKVNIKDDLDVEAEADDYAKLYNKTKANVTPTPTPGSPSGGAVSAFEQSIKDSVKLAKTERAIIETNKD